MRICCVPSGTGGVAFYRVKQPYEFLRDKMGKDVYIFDSRIHDSNRLNQEMMAADIILYQCPWSEGILDAIQLIKEGKKYGRDKKVVVEFDDDLFNVSPWNEKYHMFGVEEAEIRLDDKGSQERFLSEHDKDDWVRKRWNKDGSLTVDMWRDGHSGLNIEENLRKHKATKMIASIADLVTVTTDELAKKFRKHRPTGPLAVLPNFVDFDRWLPMKKNETDEIRIGWQGGSAHFADLHMIMDDLIKISEKYPKVKFCFMGIQYDSLMEKMKDKIEWFAWHGDVATYPLVVRDMKLDIGLCPLVDDSFNRGKSNLKWVEYSAMGIPSVVSPTVYQNEIKHGKTGLIARKGEWFKYIEELILDKDKRQDIASRANQRVRNNYNANSSHIWWDVLDDLFGSDIKRSKLNLKKVEVIKV